MTEQYKSRIEKRKKTQGKKKPKSKWIILKKIILAMFALAIVVIIAGGATFAYYISDAPELNEDLLKGNLSSKIYDRDGNEIGEIGAEKRRYVSYDEIPDDLKNAFLATEDTRFFEHHGLDIIRLGGAVIANITNGFGSEGASTITQQLVKNSFLSSEKTLKRKSQELWLSFQVERNYSKEEIFEMYLNRIYYSGNNYGVAKAAELFYGEEELKDLELHEAAMLAGIPKNPSAYNPINNPEDAKKRRDIVLSLMEKNDFITAEQAEEAKAVSIDQTLVEQEQTQSKYYAFVEEVSEEIQAELGIDPGTAGLTINTTLDTKAQDHVDKMLNEDLIAFPDDELQAGITLLDTKTGEILAIGGGRNIPVGGLNYATDTYRQPGSTMKPIVDYGPAIEYLKWPTYHPLTDEKITYSNGDSISNYDNSYIGNKSIRYHLKKSRNIPALKTYQQVVKEVEFEGVNEFTSSIGVPLQKEVEANAIGGGDELSVMQLAGAYAAFGNEGIYNKPHTVRSVEFPDGQTVELQPEGTKAMSDYTAFMITDMLKDVVTSGTGTAAAVPGVKIAGENRNNKFK
ncbi:transglycosylase domain-containing protein [Bacillus carboniphilus]|uniref:Transglycosylase domain-containing protein n=1 Tax=Bacillus carboniphilus TaxID=86663 RepID=A0ABY9JWC0_9BACI|nr:transglycosylase domain-containing protein [Bacillus carboniphilus]WLR43702.1 transglycosylase domain-containing protein [Bacillus carboniphilus]